MSGLGAWYFYSKLSVIFGVSHYEQKATPIIQAPIAVQADYSSDHVVEKLKSFFGDAKKIVPKASKERKKPEASIALHGVLVASDERKAVATISLDGGKQWIYYAGDLLADGLKLVSVQDKEVIVTGTDPRIIRTVDDARLFTGGRYRYIDKSAASMGYRIE